MQPTQRAETPPPLAVAWTGASGLVYGVRLVEVLLRAGRDVDLLVSPAVAQTAPIELGRSPAELVAGLKASGRSAEEPAVAHAGPAPGRLTLHDGADFGSPLASGSSLRAGLVVCPCSMGTAARIAAGTSDTLLLRAADVCLKERRPLILVPRETPLATHHLENLARLSARGALILPAAPGFYHRPRSIADLIDFIVQRVCDQLGVPAALTARWAQAAVPGADGDGATPGASPR